MPRATTAYASKYQRYRVWRGEYYRSETFTLEFDCKGALPAGVTISSAVWQSLNTANVIIGQAFFYDTRTTIVCTAALEPGGPVKCTVTLSNGNTLTQLFIVLVNSAPWFCADTNPSSGPCHVTADGTTVSVTLDKLGEPDTFSAAGQTILYTYTIINTGTANLSNLLLEDNVLGEVALTSTSLAAGETMVVEAEYLTTSGDVTAEEIINTATLTAEAAAGNTSAEATFTVLYVP